MSKDIDTVTKSNANPSLTHAEQLAALGIHTVTLTLVGAVCYPGQEAKDGKKATKTRWVYTWSDLMSSVLNSDKSPLREGATYNVMRVYKTWAGGHGWQVLSATPAPAKK